MATAPYIPRFFSLEELIYPELLQEHDGAGLAFWLTLDARALITLDRLRARYGPIIVNDWHVGGHYKHSGLRPMDCSEGAALSQHKFGRAFDCKFVRADVRDVIQEIITDPTQGTFEHITRIEDVPGMTWLHFDVGNHDKAAAGLEVIACST